MIKKCLGCGITLQTTNKKEKGYIPLEKYDNASYCQRCFRLTHYGEEIKMSTPYSSKEIINKINKTPHLTLFLTDFLNLTEEVFKLYHEIKTPKILIVNKCEILPKFLKKEKLINYLRDTFKVNDKIIIKGDKGSREAERVCNFIEKNQTSKIYLVGLSNSGKSTLINDLAHLLNSKIPKLTTSKNFNTTLDFLEINLTPTMTLIDTPGFFMENTLNIKKGKKIKSFVFQMKENETLNLTEEVYLKTKNTCNITYFTDISNERVIKKNYKQGQTYSTELKIKKNEDLIINGLGFLTFKQDTVIFTNIDKSFLNVRISIFGGNNEQN